MQKTDVNSILSQKSYYIWRKFMALGEHTGCHQFPERSFFYKGYQMPVCARCTGVIIGYLVAIPSYIRLGYHRRTSFLGALSMLIDWSLQATNIKPSTNTRRFITGVLGGFGIMSIQIRLTISLLSRCTKLLNSRRGGR